MGFILMFKILFINSLSEINLLILFHVFIYSKFNLKKLVLFTTSTRKFMKTSLKKLAINNQTTSIKKALPILKVLEALYTGF